MRFNLGPDEDLQRFSKDIGEKTTPDKKYEGSKEVKALTKHLEKHRLIEKWDEALGGN